MVEHLQGSVQVRDEMLTEQETYSVDQSKPSIAIRPSAHSSRARYASDQLVLQIRRGDLAGFRSSNRSSYAPEMMGLAEQLLQHCRDADPADINAVIGPEVLFDLNRGEMRCVVVRLPKRSSQPTCRPLSKRERDIVRLIAQGYPNKIIADILQISTHTVGTHIRHIFGKLGVTSRSATVARVAMLDGITRSAIDASA